MSSSAVGSSKGGRISSKVHFWWSPFSQLEQALVPSHKSISSASKSPLDEPSRRSFVTDGLRSYVSCSMIDEHFWYQSHELGEVLFGVLLGIQKFDFVRDMSNVKWICKMDFFIIKVILETLL